MSVLSNATIGVVLYNPDLAVLEANLRVFSASVGHVVLVDNASENLGEVQRMLERYPTAVLVENSSNLGIATALNQIARCAQANGDQWFLTMDQDTVMSPVALGGYAPAVEACAQQGMRVGIICPQVRHANADEFFDDDRLRPVERCITSGSLNYLAAWQEVGGFDDGLVIDEVDNDYCHRLRDKGWEIVCADGIGIDHTIGATEFKTVLGQRAVVRHYSPFRRYYQARNRILMARRFGDETVPAAVGAVGRWLLVSLVCEEDKPQKASAMLRGIWDGLTQPADFSPSEDIR